MILGPPSGTRIWLVAGQTDLRRYELNINMRFELCLSDTDSNEINLLGVNDRVTAVHNNGISR